MVFLEEWGPSIAMLVANFALAIVNILLKKILNEGISHLLVLTYRQAISAVFMIPIAYFLERKRRPKLTVVTTYLLFFSALVGGTLFQYFFLLGLKNTSPTIISAFMCLVPVVTFILALLFRLEKVSMKSRGGRAKVLGTVVSMGGALILTLYKGMPFIRSPSYSHEVIHHTKKRWFIGSVASVLATLMSSSWFLLQARIGKKYPCQYSSTAIMSFFGAIQSAILCFILERKVSWMVTGGVEISSLVYAGMVGSGLCFVVLAWCVKRKGPVFTAAFTPCIQLFAAIFDISILREQIHLGSVLGSVIVVTGMYILLWGKSDEARHFATTPVPSVKEDEVCNQLPVEAPVTNTPTST